MNGNFRKWHRVITGFTLLELLVAVSVFLLLSMLLVGLLRGVFDLWESGEKRGDLYERGQAILDQLQDDCNAVYVHRKNKVILQERYPPKPLPNEVIYPEAGFYVTSDRLNNCWLYLVRSGEGDLYQSRGDSYTPNLMRVAYGLVTDEAELKKLSASGKSVLVRMMVGEIDARSIWNDTNVIDALVPGLSLTPAPTVFDGVVYFAVRNYRDAAEYSAPAGLPLNQWDSRPQRLPSLQSGALLVPAQTLPAAVQVELTLRPMIATGQKIKLMQAITAETTTLKISNAKDLPDPPGYLRIDSEWMRYERKDSYTLSISQRGARNTAAQPHGADREIEFGQSFFRTFYSPR